jgi:hypothetical protein
MNTIIGQGTPTINMRDVDLGLWVRGKYGGGTGNQWFTSIENIRFSGVSKTLVKIGEGDTWHSTFRRCWFQGSDTTTVQLVCMTNTNAAAYRDYFTLYERCVFRSGKYSIVIGGDWSSGSLVLASQSVNRVKITDSDFYGFDTYGIYMAGGGSNGHTIKGVHFDSARAGAIADIHWSSSHHYVEGMFESGAEHAVHFVDANAGGNLVINHVQGGSRVSLFKVGTTVYPSTYLPLSVDIPNLIYNGRTGLGNIQSNFRLQAQNIYPTQKTTPVRMRGPTGSNTRIEFGAYDVDTNSYDAEYQVSVFGIFPATAFENLRDLGLSTNRWRRVWAREVRPGDGSPIWTSGTGTPEGALTAPVGSLWTRTDGGEGTTLYVKETGAGNTGWATRESGYLQGSKTFDFASIADGAAETTTVTVTGAALGDFVESVSLTQDLQGMTMAGYVSAADTVFVRLKNETGAPIDLASGTLRARVRKA